MLWTVPYFMGDEISALSVVRDHRIIRQTLGGETPQERMGALYRELAECIAQSGPEPPIVVAGDCVASLGVVGGLQRRHLEPVLVWFDAHGDFHTWATTASDFIGGMPLAMLTGRGEQTIMQMAGVKPLADEDVILVGARDLDPGEDEALEGSGVTATGIEGASAVVPEGRSLYVHIDVDVVDPSDMPAVNYPAPDGPSLADVGAALRDLAATGRVVACSFSSWNPALPAADRAAAGVGYLIDEALAAG